jgi:adenylylsulfate kinase-like enzyme
MIEIKDNKKGKIFLVTGLSGAGKSTLGKAITNMLKEIGKRVYFLDGDEVRKFFGTIGQLTEEQRLEQGKRIAFASSLLSMNGIDVIVGVTLGQKYLRDYIKSKIDFIEIFLDANVNDCIKNDPNGFYAERLKLEKPLLRGIDLPFEKPENPDLVLYPYKEDKEKSLEKIKEFLKKLNYL